MKWYFCFNDRVADWLGPLIKASVNSALRNTTLEPHCVYSGKPGATLRWLESKGVNVILRDVYFAGELTSEAVIKANSGDGYDPHAAKGFFLPLEIPYIEQTDEFVLFTDTDVIFVGEVDLTDCRPPFLAAAAEVGSIADFKLPEHPSSFNSGVMIFNVPAMRNEKDNLLQVLRGGNFYRSSSNSAIYDQWALNATFKTRWTRLADEYNWRACWPRNRQAKLLHFHGPKPSHLIAYEHNPATISMDYLREMITRFKENYKHSMEIYDQYVE